MVIMLNLLAPHCSLFPCRSDVLCFACVTWFATVHVEGVHLPPASFCLWQIAIVLLGPPPVTNVAEGRRQGESKAPSGWHYQGEDGNLVLPMHISNWNILFPESIWVLFSSRGACVLNLLPVERNISNLCCPGFITSLQAFLSSVSITRGGRWFNFPYKHRPISVSYPDGKIILEETG